MSLSQPATSSWLLRVGPQVLLLFIVAGIVSQLYKGIRIRMQFRKMKAQGIVRQAHRCPHFPHIPHF